MKHYVNCDDIGNITAVGQCDDFTWDAMGTGVRQAMPLRSLRGGVPFEVTPEPPRVVEIPEQPQGMIEDYMRENYVSGEEVVPRDPMPVVPYKTDIIADGIDLALITGLPRPVSIVTISGLFVAGPFEVTDGELSIAMDRPGTITARITCDPHFVRTDVVINGT